MRDPVTRNQIRLIGGTGVAVLLLVAPQLMGQAVSSGAALNRPINARQALRQKLNRIVIPKISFDNVALPEVVKAIQSEIARTEPGGKGINFQLNPFLADVPSPTFVSSPDGTSVIPSSSPPVSEPTDFDTIFVKVSPPLHDLTLAQVLDVVMKSASTPVRFTLEDYGVVFFRSTPEAVALASRQFKVNPNTFQQGLQGVTTVTVLTPSGGQNGQGNSGGVNIPAVIAAPGGGSSGISGVTSPSR